MTTDIYLRLTQGKHARIGATDFPKASAHKWYAVRSKWTFYAATNIKGRRVYLHRFLLGLGTGRDQVVDHINHDGLDNRRENLRICTPSMNSLNRRDSIERADIAGTYRNKGRWSAKLKFGGRVIHLGTFDTQWEAAIAYTAARTVVMAYAEAAHVSAA